MVETEKNVARNDNMRAIPVDCILRPKERALSTKQAVQALTRRVRYIAR